MPSLLLQPLVENAIKYAIAPREQGGSIHIRSHVIDDVLHLEVCDDGPGLTDATRIYKGRGVGLRNTQDRLRVLYGEHGSARIENAHPGLRVALSFPIERPDERA